MYLYAINLKHPIFVITHLIINKLSKQEAEWKQFQSDLLMTVRVANDFKTEAQRELERLVSENKVARDRIRLLEDQMHSIKGKWKNEGRNLRVLFWMRLSKLL